MPQGLMIAAAVAGAVQAVSSGLAQAASAENQAKAAEANSRQAALGARIAESQGQIDASRTARDWIKQLGRQRAALAQGGVLESATGRLLREETERKARDDAFQVQFNADLKKQGYLFESADLANRAKVARSQASRARLGAALGGIGSLAGGVNKIYSGV